MNHTLSKPQCLLLLSLCTLTVLTICANQLLAIWFASSDQAWTPINSLNFITSDRYYFASAISKLITSHQFHNQVDYFRLFPYAFAALPSVLIDDFRFVYLVNYILAFTGLYLITYKFIKDFYLPSASVYLPFFYIFYYGLWELLFSAPGIFNSGYDFSYFSTTFLLTLTTGIKQLIDLPLFDLVSLYRYLTLSSTAFLLLVYFYLLVKNYHQADNRYWLALTLYSPLMLLTYLPHMVIAYSLLAFFALYSLLQGRSAVFFRLFITGSLTLLIIYFTDYYQLLKQSHSSYQIIDSIYQNIIEFKPVATKDLLMALILNKYTLIFLLLLPMKSWLRLRQVGLTVSAMGIVMSAIFPTMLSISFYTRFLGRGIDILVFLLAVIACHHLFYQLSQRFHRLALAKYVLIPLLVLVPVYGMVKQGVQLATDGSHQLADTTWQTYQWIKHNTDPQARFMTLNTQDMTLIPILAGRDMLWGHIDVTSDSFEHSLECFLGFYKLLGFNRQQVQSIFQQSPKLYDQHMKRLYHRGAKQTEQEFFIAHLLFRLFYYPHVTQYQGMTLVNDDLEINPDILALVLKRFDQISIQQFIAENKNVYILLDKSAPSTLTFSHNVVYQNADKLLIQFSKN